jgi:hypothetical protein
VESSHQPPAYEADALPLCYITMAPEAGIEPTTNWLTVNCTTAVLLWNKTGCGWWNRTTIWSLWDFWITVTLTRYKLGGPKENRTPINGVTSRYTDHYTMRPNWWRARDSNPVCLRRQIYSLLKSPMLLALRNLMLTRNCLLHDTEGITVSNPC